MPFTERSPLEQGFTAVYEAEIQPQLNEFEFERQAVLKRTYLLMALCVAAAVAASFVLAQFFDPIGAVIVGVMIAAFSMFWIWGRAADKWGGKVKDIAMPAICDHVGDLEYEANGSRFPMAPMMDLKLLPKHDRASLSSRFHGTHNGATFQMVRATLTSTYTDNDNRTRTTTEFAGLLFRIDLPTPAPGRIALMRDRGGVGNKLAETFAFGSTRSLPKVTFDDAPFEAAFEVYASDPDGAQAYLDEALRAALLTVGRGHGEGIGGKGLVAGFVHKAFYVALERRSPAITMGALNTPVSEIEDDLHRAFDNIALAHEIVGTLTNALPSEAQIAS